MSSTIVLWIVGGIIIIGLLWAVGGYVVIRKIEKPSYTVLETKDGYEVREYAPYIVAKTTVSGKEQHKILNEGFRIIADYIFGNNTSGTKVAMTAPVIAEKSGQKIAMTAPVLAEQDAATGTVAFIMPSEYSLETLPTPNDSRVTLAEVPAKIVAVRSFSWYASDRRVEREKEALLALLAKDEKTPIGTPYYAGYNPPFTLPFMQHHEVMVEISQ